MKARLLGPMAAAFDKAMLAAVRTSNRTRQSRAERLSHEERMDALVAIEAAYDVPDDAFFVRPGPIHPSLGRVRSRVFDASWPSDSEPFLADIRDRYLAHRANRTAHARLYLGDTPRPAIVLIHGYLAGHWWVEERAWPIDWLAERYDLALAVLPFHALRSRTDRRSPPPFSRDRPAHDPNEGFRPGNDLRSARAFIAVT